MCTFDQIGEQYRIAAEKPPAYKNFGWFFETAMKFRMAKLPFPPRRNRCCTKSAAMFTKPKLDPELRVAARRECP
jgi:hypothetical protein